VVSFSVDLLYRPYSDVYWWGNGANRQGLFHRVWNVRTPNPKSVGAARESHRFRFPLSRDVPGNDNMRLDLPESVSLGGIQRWSCSKDCRKGRKKSLSLYESSTERTDPLIKIN